MPIDPGSRCPKFLLSLLLLLTISSQLIAAEKVPHERRLPRETFLYFSIGDAPAFARQLEKTSAGQLYQDKSLGDFWKQFQAKLAEKQKDVEKKLGIELSDFAHLAQGEVTVAVSKGGGHGLGLAFFLHYGDKQGSVEKLMTKAESAATEEGAQRQEQSVDETKIVSWTFTEKDEDDDKEKSKKPAEKDSLTLAYFLKDNTFVLSTEAELLKHILHRWDGQHEQTFAKHEIHRYIAERCRDENHNEASALNWFVDPVGMFSALATSPRHSSPQLMMAVGFLPAIGLSKVKGWGGALEMGGSEFDMVHRSLLYLDTPATGITNLLQFQESAQAPPKWVRSDVAAYASFNWDLEKAVGGVEAIADVFVGPGGFAKKLDEVADAPNGPKLHPRKDLLNHLSGHMHIVSAKPKEDSDSAEAPVLIGFELKDSAALKGALAKILALAGSAVKTRDFQGETIHEIPRGKAPAGKNKDDDEETAATSMGFAIADNCLFFSNDVRLVEQVLRTSSDQEQLADSPAYKQVGRKFPPRTTGINFTRQDMQTRAAYNLVRSGVLAKQLGVDSEIDFSLLPEFSALEKYFTASGGYTVQDEHGLKSISFSLPVSESK